MIFDSRYLNWQRCCVNIIPLLFNSSVHNITFVLQCSSNLAMVLWPKMINVILSMELLFHTDWTFTALCPYTDDMTIVCDRSAETSRTSVGNVTPENIYEISQTGTHWTRFLSSTLHSIECFNTACLRSPDVRSTILDNWQWVIRIYHLIVQSSP